MLSDRRFAYRIVSLRFKIQLFNVSVDLITIIWSYLSIIFPQNPRGENHTPSSSRTHVSVRIIILAQGARWELLRKSLALTVEIICVVFVALGAEVKPAPCNQRCSDSLLDTKHRHASWQREGVQLHRETAWRCALSNQTHSPKIINAILWIT